MSSPPLYPSAVPGVARSTAGLALASVLALVAGGCGSSTEPAGDSGDTGDGRIVVWADQKRSDVLKPFAADFGKQNGVTVDVEVISEDLQTTFVTAAKAGKGPDVVVGAHDWIGNLVQNGTIDPVQLSEQQRGEFNPLAVDAVTFKDQVYGVPYAVENLALIRNTDLAAEAPGTVEDLVATGKRLTKQDKASEILALQVGQNGDPYHLQPLFTSGGGYLFGTKSNGDDDPSDLGVDSDGAVAAFEKIRKLGEKGERALKRSITAENAISVFTDEKAAFLVSGPWALTEVKKAGIPYDISAVPPFRGAEPARPFVGVQAFFLASGSDNQALAQELVTNFLAQPDVAVALYKAEPRAPALTAAMDQLRDTDPDLAKFLAAGEHGQVMPAIPQMAAIWDPFGKAQAAIIGGAPVKSTLDAAAKAIRSQIK